MPTKCEDCEKYYESEWLEPICRAYGIILPASHKEKPYCHPPDMKRKYKYTLNGETYFVVCTEEEIERFERMYDVSLIY